MNKELDAFLAALHALDRAVEAMAAGWPSEAHCLARALLRVCGASSLLMAPLLHQPPREIGRDECDEVALRLRRGFGAPGDWGYETPLGKALAAVYETCSRLRS